MTDYTLSKEEKEKILAKIRSNELSEATKADVSASFFQSGLFHFLITSGFSELVSTAEPELGKRGVAALKGIFRLMVKIRSDKFKQLSEIAQAEIIHEDIVRIATEVTFAWQGPQIRLIARQIAVNNLRTGEGIPSFDFFKELLKLVIEREIQTRIVEWLLKKIFSWFQQKMVEKVFTSQAKGWLVESGLPWAKSVLASAAATPPPIAIVLIAMAVASAAIGITVDQVVLKPIETHVEAFQTRLRAGIETRTRDETFKGIKREPVSLSRKIVEKEREKTAAFVRASLAKKRAESAFIRAQTESKIQKKRAKPILSLKQKSTFGAVGDILRQTFFK